MRGAADRPARAVWIAPTPRHSLPRPHPLPWISLSRARQLPSPPSTNRSATGLRTPPRRTKKSRRRPLRCLRQATRAEKPCSIVPVLIFNLRPPATSPWIRGLQCVPDLIDYAIEFTVSSFPFPLLFFAWSRATAPPPPPARVPEHRRLPWPPSSLAPSPSARTRGTRALLVARGCHLGHQLLPYPLQPRARTRPSSGRRRGRRRGRLRPPQHMPLPPSEAP